MKFWERVPVFLSWRRAVCILHWGCWPGAANVELDQHTRVSLSSMPLPQGISLNREGHLSRWLPPISCHILLRKTEEGKKGSSSSSSDSVLIGMRRGQWRDCAGPGKWTTHFFSPLPFPPVPRPHVSSSHDLTPLISGLLLPSIESFDYKSFVE